MILFEEVPEMIDSYAYGIGNRCLLDGQKCEDLATACGALDIWAEDNEIGDENLTAELEGGTSVVLRVLACSFLMENGKDDALYIAFGGADEISFRQVDSDTVMLEERFNNVLSPV